MSTTLYAITNARLDQDNKNMQAQLILKRLEDLNLKTTRRLVDGKYIDEIGGWSFVFDDNFGENEELEFYGIMQLYLSFMRTQVY
jgi:hypothetical protein